MDFGWTMESAEYPTRRSQVGVYPAGSIVHPKSIAPLVPHPISMYTDAQSLRILRYVVQTEVFSSVHSNCSKLYSYATFQNTTWHIICKIKKKIAASKFDFEN